MGNTRMGLSYPDGDDPVDVEKDLKQLACELDHLISLECPDPEPCPDPDPPGIQYPPDLTGVDGHVVVSNRPLTWDVLPTQDADNGSLRDISDGHSLYKIYEFDARLLVHTAPTLVLHPQTKPQHSERKPVSSHLS